MGVSGFLFHVIPNIFKIIKGVKGGVRWSGFSSSPVTDLLQELEQQHSSSLEPDRRCVYEQQSLINTHKVQTDVKKVLLELCFWSVLRSRPVENLLLCCPVMPQWLQL